MSPDSVPLRLAYFSPLPPARSGIAGYSYDLLPELAQLCELVLFVPQPETVESALHHDFAIRDLSGYASERWQFDAALYQMGNSSHHQPFYELMRRYPGILVLHDFVLHHFIAEQSVGQGNFAAFSREMAYALGPAGADEAWAIRLGQTQHRLSDVALNERLLDLSLGVLVHSRYARDAVLASRPQCRAYTVSAPVVAHSTAQTRRHELPWSGNALILASFGQVTAGKQLNRALRVFARLQQQWPQTRYLIVGEVLPEAGLEQMLQDEGLADKVHITGYVEGLDTFGAWLETADVVLNLRHPTLGETSAAALRAMAAAQPVVVYDHGWYAELPDDVVVKVPPLDDEALFAALEQLAADARQRKQIGQRAQEYTAIQHHPSTTARDYVSAMRHFLQHV
jgi:glycosyltransferase involved in cell wall biosynthesis